MLRLLLLVLDSWGSRNASYIRECSELDRFTHDHVHFLPLFSAGNRGSVGLGSVVAPGVTKNVLTIGSTLSSRLKVAKGIVDDVGLPRPLTCDSETLQESSETLQHKLAPFSGQGPTLDGRIKPEVVTAGMYIVSARSMGPVESVNGFGRHESECESCASSLLPLFGTSMSTALAAGAVALVSQYYADGYHCTGQPQTACRHKPTAALLKATVIHSAINDVQQLNEDELQPVMASMLQTDHSLGLDEQQSNDGQDEDDAFDSHQAAAVTQPDMPFDCCVARRSDESSNHQQDECYAIDAEWSPRPTSGFGRIQLNSALKAGSSSNANKLHFIADDPDRTLLTGQSYAACFVFNSSSATQPDTTPYAARATLAWTDPPASRLSHVQLVNDLDLSVRIISATSPSANRELLGNHFRSCPSASQSGSATQSQPLADDRNNAEQVTVSHGLLSKDDRLLVQVDARHVVSFASSSSRRASGQAFSLVVTGQLKPLALDRCETALA